MSMFIVGVGTIIGLYCLNFWVKDRRGRQINWWQWILVAIWVLTLFFTTMFIFTSLGENEARAALTGGGFLLAISVILGIGLYRVLFVMSKKG